MKSREYKATVFCCVLLMCVCFFVVDSYLPSLPRIASDFATKNSFAQLSVSLFFVGEALAPLIYGPASDRFGRKRVLYYTLAISVIGSIICIFSQNIYTLIVGRIILGCGIGTGPSLARAIGTDISRGKDLSKLTSLFGVIIGIMPSLAPYVGGLIQDNHNWKYTSVLNLILILFTLFCVFQFLPETCHIKEKNNHRKYLRNEGKKILNNYINLIFDKNYIIYPICAGLCFAGIMTYINISPFLFQNILHYTAKEFGGLSVISGVCIIIGSLLNSLIVKRVSMNNMMILGGFLMFFGGLIMFLLGLFSGVTVYNILVPYSVFTIGIQFILANAFPLCMLKVKEMKGAASSLYNGIQMLISAIFCTLVAFIDISDQCPLGIILSIVGGLSIIIVLFFLWDSKIER